MTPKTNPLRRALLLVSLAWACGAAQAAGYPDRPIQLVVPFPAGGAGDGLARILSAALQTELGQTVVVDNKPGGGTIIGTQAVARAKPDGYTLLVSGNSTFTVNPAVQPKLPYDPVREFEPVGLLAVTTLVLVANNNTPASNVQQLVSAIKAKPDQFSYGSFGNATTTHFAGELFNLSAGVKATHVPYKGSAAMLTDLIGGQIPMSFDTVVAALPHIKSGKIKAIAVTTTKRSSFLPDVPTIAESGLPGYEMNSWMVLAAPKGLPPDVRSRLGDALAAVMRKPDTLERMKAMGYEPAYSRIPDWTGFLGKEIGQLQGIALRAQIKAD